MKYAKCWHSILYQERQVIDATLQNAIPGRHTVCLPAWTNRLLLQLEDDKKYQEADVFGFTEFIYYNRNGFDENTANNQPLQIVN